MVVVYPSIVLLPWISSSSTKLCPTVVPARKSLCDAKKNLMRCACTLRRPAWGRSVHPSSQAHSGSGGSRNPCECCKLKEG